MTDLIKQREELLYYLKKNPSIETKVTSYYAGGLDGGSLYRDSTTLQLILEGEVILEVSL